MAGTTNFKLTIWGTPRAGKTTFLVMLYNAFRAQHDTWEIRADQRSQNYIEKVSHEIFQLSSFPEKTAETRTYQYHITHKQSRQSFTLTFVDPPGELYKEYHAHNRQQSAQITQRGKQLTTDWTPQQVFDELKTSDGIIILLDPAWVEPQKNEIRYEVILDQLFEDLYSFRREEGRPDPLVALCHTKIDGKDELWKKRDTINPSLCFREAHSTSREQSCRQNCHIFRLLGENFMIRLLPSRISRERVRCFAVSSIGRIEGRDLNVGDQSAWRREITPTPPALENNSATERVADFNEPLNAVSVRETLEPTSIFDAQKISPYKVLEPIEWMFGNNFNGTQFRR